MAKNIVTDLTGRRYGRLSVLEIVPRHGLKCRCDCGAIKIVRPSSLLHGSIKSCGCLRIERIAKEGRQTRTHGQTNTKLYRAWASMLSRCSNPRHADWKNYGARGIRVCVEWKSFTAFMAWAQHNGPHDGLSLDRINNDGNYEPANCRWTTTQEQHNNTRRNRYIEWNGTSRTIAQWTRYFGASKSYISNRLQTGMSAQDALDSLCQPIKH